MNPVVYLHIGTNKTGTSSIQEFLAGNRKKLLKKGILVPKTGFSGYAHYGMSGLLGFDHEKHLPANVDGPELTKVACDLRQEIERAEPRKVIISSEMFILDKPIAPVKKFFSNYDVRIVVYFRRHDHWWLSVYNQAVKSVVNPPWQRGLPQYLKYMRVKRLKYGNYRYLLDRWAKAFGTENLIVRPFEHAQNPGGIVADFFRSIGLGELSGEAEAVGSHANRSLSPKALFLLDVIQRAEMPSSTRELLKKNVFSGEHQGECGSLMSPTLRRKLIDEHRLDYEYIARKYLGRADGVLFTEQEPSTDDSWDRPEKPNIIDVVSWVASKIS